VLKQKFTEYPNYYDNKDFNFALKLADQIHEKTGKVISEKLIFDYINYVLLLLLFI
jgi:hypothetical protein